MPAAVWRTRPARSISLWLTICASEGLSLRTGRKARDHRIAGRSSGHSARLATAVLCARLLLLRRHRRGTKAPSPIWYRDNARAARLLILSERTGPSVGFGVRQTDWGRFAATTSKGAD